jgi:hypothetical protein
MITFRMPIRNAQDLYILLQQLSLVGRLTSTSAGFRKKLLEQIEKKGGEKELLRALWRLHDFVGVLRDAPVTVEATVAPDE